MRPLNLLQYSKDLWYCPDTQTYYRKTTKDKPYTIYRRERAVDLRDGKNNDILFKDHIVGMNEKQLPVHGENINAYQPNYRTLKRRRHKRRKGRKTVPSNTQPASTKYLEPLTVEEYHKRYCVQDVYKNIWTYAEYNYYTPPEQKTNTKTQEELYKKCLTNLRSKMGSSKKISELNEHLRNIMKNKNDRPNRNNQRGYRNRNQNQNQNRNRRRS
jgi:hypothetical protein